MWGVECRPSSPPLFPPFFPTRKRHYPGPTTTANRPHAATPTDTRQGAVARVGPLARATPRAPRVSTTMSDHRRRTTCRGEGKGGGAVIKCRPTIGHAGSGHACPHRTVADCPARSVVPWMHCGGAPNNRAKRETRAERRRPLLFPAFARTSSARPPLFPKLCTPSGEGRGREEWQRRETHSHVWHAVDSARGLGPQQAAVAWWTLLPLAPSSLLARSFLFFLATLSLKARARPTWARNTRRTSHNTHTTKKSKTPSNTVNP